MYKFNIPKISLAKSFKWLISRVAVIYLILFIFTLSFVDLKMLDSRIKVRHLNQAVPGFTDMINFDVGKIEEQNMDWAPYKHYFLIILRYLPTDIIAKQFLGIVNYYTGQEPEAIVMLKNSSEMNGHLILWSNYNLGVIYYKKGMWPQAAEYLFKAVSLNPQLTLILMRNSIVYKQIFATPAFTYNLEDEVYQTKTRAYILLLSTLHNLGQYEKMVIIANLALSDPNLTNKDAFYYYAGLAFYESGQLDKAYLFFQKSILLEKDDPDPYFYIANILQSAGRQQQAQGFLQISYTLHQRNDPRFPYDKHVNLRFF